jgi:RND family efflux transporter MFP subunit
MAGLRRWGLIALVAAAVVGAAVFAGLRLFGPPTVSVATPTRGPAIQAVYATGTVEPSVMLPIAPRVTGRLVRLAVDEGATVRRGQVLAQLEADDMRASVSELQARARQARDDLARAQKLLDAGVATRVNRDRARTELRALEAQISRMQAQLGYTELRAPADGLVIRRDGEVGELMTVNQPVFWLSCCAPLRIEAEVDEEDMPQVKLGQAVLIRADAFPDQVFNGRVQEITPKGDAVARSYRVRVALPETTPLMIGMTAETNILISRRDNAVLVPAAAVSDGEVWVVTDGRAERRAVRTGVSSGTRIEVLEGLSGSETLILDAPATLEAGQRVRVQAATAPDAPSPTGGAPAATPDGLPKG